MRPLAVYLSETCASLAESPTPHPLQVLGTTKNAALVLFCVVFLRERVAALQACGYAVALAGFTWYQRIKIVTAAERTREAAKGGRYSDLDSIPLTSATSAALKSVPELHDRGHVANRR